MSCSTTLPTKFYTNQNAQARKFASQSPIMTSHRQRFIGSPRARTEPYSSTECLKETKEVSAKTCQQRLVKYEKPPRVVSASSKGNSAAPRRPAGGVIENKWRRQTLGSPDSNRISRSANDVATITRQRPGTQHSSTPLASSRISCLKSPKSVSPASRARKSNSPYQSPGKSLLMKSRARARLRLTPEHKDVARSGIIKLQRDYKSMNSYDDDKRGRRVSFSDEINSKLASKEAVINKLKIKLSESEKSYENRLKEQKNLYEKQLKQASDLVRICLGKVKEAEQRNKKIPNLEMEIIALRRQLVERSSQSRLCSVGSILSDYGSDLDQSDRRVTPVGDSSCDSYHLVSTTTSPVQSDSESHLFKERSSKRDPISETLRCAVAALSSPVLPSPKMQNQGTNKHGRVVDADMEIVELRDRKVSVSSCDDLSTTSSSRDRSVDTAHLSKLMKDHKKAMMKIKQLEEKYTSQRTEMNSLKRVVHIVRSQCEPNLEFDRLMNRLRNENASRQLIGKLVYDTLHNALFESNENFVASFVDVIRRSGIPLFDTPNSS